MNGAESLAHTRVANGVDTCFANPGTSEMHFVSALDRVAGLGNAIANLHNAKRAHSPIVNIVGDHASYHRPYDAPLTADTEGIARALRSGTPSMLVLSGAALGERGLRAAARVAHAAGRS